MRGHYIFEKPFSASLRGAVFEIAHRHRMNIVVGGTYGQVNGPRFNSQIEMASLSRSGVQAISQTAGIEVILAGELEIPVVLVGFGVGYANRVKPEPTTEPVLRDNLSLSREQLTGLALTVASEANLDSIRFDQGFIYRF